MAEKTCEVAPRAAASRRYMATALHIALSSALLWGIGVWDASFFAEDAAQIHAGHNMLQDDFWGAVSGRNYGGAREYYRPAAYFSLGVDYALWGGRPAGFRLTNLLLHVACCLLVWRAATLLLPASSPLFALFATALFAFHPVHEFTILWISGRFDLLCAFFYLAAAVCFLHRLRFGGRLYLGLALLCSALAIASKEMAYSILPVFFILALWATSKRTIKGKLSAATLECAPFAGITATFLLIRILVLPPGATVYAVQTNLSDLLVVVRLTVRHLFLPYGISFRELAARHPAWFAGAVAGAGLLGCLQLRRGPWAFIALCMLIVIVSTLPLIRVMSPWCLYIPSVSWCMAAALYLTPRRGWRGVCAWALAALLLGSYVAQIQSRKPAWQSADAASKSVVEGIEAFEAQMFDLRPLLISVPGTVAGVPVYMYGLSEHLRMTTNRHDLEPQVLLYAVFPVGVQHQGLTVEAIGPDAWRVVPADPDVYFAFPDVPAERYRHYSHFRPGDVISPPWGRVEVEAVDERGRPTVVVARLDPKSADQFAQPLYYSAGQLERADAWPGSQ